MKKNIKKGKVYLVGAGPGDPGLLTVRGREFLGQADVVAYDHLVNPALLDLAPHANKVYAGKEHKPNKPAGREQERINRLLVSLAQKGKKVVRLKGGDPFVFGRGGEEATFLRQHGIDFEIVPGVTAGYAVPAYAGIPITDRRLASLVTFVTGHEDPEKNKPAVRWEEIAKTGGTIVSFMGLQNLAAMTKALMRGGLSPKMPVSIIEKGTLPGQRVIEGYLKNIAQKAAQEKLGSPSLVVIGEVNRLRKNLDWFGKKSLKGKTVLITRAQTQASQLKEALEKEGAKVLEFPAIRIAPPKSWAPLDKALKGMCQFDWLVFTSTNGVEYFFNRLDALKKDARIFSSLKIAAIGQATAKALQVRGLQADLVPQRFTSEELLRELQSKKQIAGRKFLLARTDIAPGFLRKGLEKSGAEVTEVTVYRTLREKQKPVKEMQNGKQEKIDFLTFTSASTVKNFFEALPKQNRFKINGKMISIGPITSKELKSFGFKPFSQAKEHTIPGLVNAVIHAAREKK